MTGARSATRRSTAKITALMTWSAAQARAEGVQAEQLLRSAGPSVQTIERKVMATAAKSTAKSKTPTRAAPRRTRRTGRRDPLAISLLKQDHRQVETWFDEYEQLESDKERLALFNKIALALKVHTRIEEEIFYPAERGEVEDDLLDEAYVEHDSAKKLIAEIEAMKPSDEFYDAKVKVLGEYIKHHVKEEEQPGGLFSQAKKGDEDLDQMGERLKARKTELMAELGRSAAH